MTPLIRKLSPLMKEEAPSMMWFDIGKMDGFDMRWSTIQHAKLPYDKCCIVGRYPNCPDCPETAMVIAYSVDDEEGVFMLMGTRIFHDHHETVEAFIVKIESDHFEVGSPDDDTDVDKTEAARIVAILAEFLASINLTGYRATLNPNGITNRRRAKKGKPLQYSWHTVVIEPPTQRAERLGGTHASPRQHERRGHWRITPKGNRVWVRNCTVGDPSRGTVMKDYIVGNQQ